MATKTILERRRDAAQATVDHFRDRPFDLAKKNDCAHIVLYHLKQLGVKIPVSKVGSYKSPVSARAAIKRAFGVDNLPAVADKYFEPISPAQALVGDLIEFRGVDSPIGALSVYLGFELVYGYVDGVETGAVPARIIYHEGEAPLRAWRVLPL